MPATYFAINRSLNSDFGAQSGSAPSTWYLGLSTAILTKNNISGSEASEPGDTYARVAIPNDKSNWTTVSGVAGSLVNIFSGSFPQSTTPWGTIYSTFLADSATTNAGKIWYYYPLSPAITVQENTSVPIDAGAIQVTRE